MGGIVATADMKTLTTILSLAICLVASTASADPTWPSQTYPRDAFLVTVEDAATLQEALDTHRVVRLERGEYRCGECADEANPLRLSSGMQIYGLGVSTSLPPAIVEPGTTGLVLSNLSFPHIGLTFPASEEVTRDNLFFFMSGRLNIEGARFEDNVVVGLEGGAVLADTREGGWLRNNRFIRIRAHYNGRLLDLVGDEARQSYGNVFVWGNHLGGPDNSVSVESYPDVTLVGYDVESYDSTREEPTYDVHDVDTLRLWTAGGATSDDQQPVFDIGATEASLYTARMSGRTEGPFVVFREAVERAVSFNGRDEIRYDNPAGVLYGSRGSGVQGNAEGEGRSFWRYASESETELVSEALPAEDAEALRALYRVRPERIAWDRPTFDPIPDPTGPDWDADLASQPDSTAMLQALIDADEVVMLDPGIYYVSSSLEIRGGTTIVGAGADRTAIVATSPDVDIFVYDRDAEGSRYHIQMMDLTLQGGRNGVHLEGEPGNGGQYSQFLYSHLVFRDFSNAGFFVNQIFGLDNGLFYHVDFVNSGTGFKQYVDRSDDYEGGGPNSGYVDKVTFYNCQFVGNDLGADLSARRGDNLNSFTSCRFEDNANGAIYAPSNIDLQLIHSDLINNGGDPSVYGVSDIVSCYFRADERGESLISNGRIEGSRFERGSSTTARLYSHSGDVFWSANGSWANWSNTLMVNSSADDIEVGNVTFGVFLNSDLPARPDLSKPAVTVFPEVVEERGVGVRPEIEVLTLVDGEVNPRPQLLVRVDPAGEPGPGGGDAGPGGVGPDGGASAGDASTAGGGDGGGGCGCRTAPGRGGAMWAFLVLGALVFRRRAVATRRAARPGPS